MRAIVAILIVIIAQSCPADANEGWRDAAQFFASVSNRDNAAVGAAMDAAISPLQFRRDVSARQHPTNLLRGLVAAYAAGTFADAQVFEASRPGCFYIHVENYDKTRVGLAAEVRTAIERGFRASFGQDVAFFTDSQCSHSL
jgi:hypothetical protein